MDHSWGRNVIAYGLGDLGATLAGVNAVLPSATVLLTNDLKSGLLGRWEVPTDTSLPITSTRIPRLNPAAHFPYGWTVAPDGPV